MQNNNNNNIYKDEYVQLTLYILINKVKDVQKQTLKYHRHREKWWGKDKGILLSDLNRRKGNLGAQKLFICRYFEENLVR